MKQWKPSALVWAAWTSLGLLMAVQNHFLYQAQALPGKPWSFTLGYGLGFAWLWAGLTPLILWLARRFRMDSRRWPLHLPVHLGAGLLLALVDAAYDTWVLSLFLDPLRAPFDAQFLYQVRPNVLTYLLAVGIVHAIDYYALFNERRLTAVQLQVRLAQAREQALRAQLQPHFLFNALNTIAELVHEDPDAADRMVMRLGDLLRLTLEGGGEQLVPLEQEIRLADAYLAIEQVRFGDRLRAEWCVQPDARHALVPQLVLQPLVENAVRHGIGPQAGHGVIRVSAERGDGSLRVDVVDTGRGPPDDLSTLREGVGLGNTRMRLQELYGPDHDLVIAARQGGGAVVSIRVPFRRGEDAPAALQQGEHR